MDGAEDAEVGSGTSSTTRSAENLLSDMAEDAEVGGNSDGDDDEIVKRSPPSKNVKRIYRGILPPYAPTLIAHLLQKDEFPLIVLAMVEALS